MDHFSAEQPKTDISYIKLYRATELLKSTISPSYCTKVFKDCEKNLKKSMSQKGFDVKNLTGAYKSETWNLHAEEWFAEHRDVMLNRISNMLRPNVGMGDYYTINMIESWYAKYTDDSIVAPHSHNIHYGHWSFCWYLNTAPNGTVLYFMDGHSEQYPHRFFPGDLVIFPGDLIHWSNDTSNDRKIISGNFLLTIEPQSIVDARQENI